VNTYPHSSNSHTPLIEDAAPIQAEPEPEITPNHWVSIIASALFVGANTALLSLCPFALYYNWVGFHTGAVNPFWVFLLFWPVIACWRMTILISAISLIPAGIAGAALGSSLVGIFVFIIAFCFGVYRVWQRRKRNREQGEKFKLSRQLPLLMRVFWSAAAVSLLGSYIALAVINPWRLCAEPPQRTAWKSNDPVIEPRPAPTPVPTPARVTNNKALYTIHTRAEYDA
jgi:hypothetical protein